MTLAAYISVYISIDNDLNLIGDIEMTVVAVTSGAERRNGGTVLFGGNTSGTRVNNLSMTTNITPQKFTPAARGSHYNGVDSLFKATAVTLVTDTSQSSSTGFCKITKTSHGLVVGDFIRVEGTDVSNYNTVHRVTSVLSSSTVQTDIVYTADTTTPGTYKKLARNFDRVVANRYVGMIIGSYIAGTADNTLVFGGSFMVQPYNVATGDYRYNISSINAFTGAVTLGANAGVLNKYHDIDNDNQNLVSEPLPTRAVPGRLVYQYGALVPAQASYNAKTN